jgi:hypothetical protein
MSSTLLKIEIYSIFLALLLFFACNHQINPTCFFVLCNASITKNCDTLVWKNILLYLLAHEVWYLILAHRGVLHWSPTLRGYHRSEDAERREQRSLPHLQPKPRYELAPTIVISRVNTRTSRPDPAGPGTRTHQQPWLAAPWRPHHPQYANTYTNVFQRLEENTTTANAAWPRWSLSP